MTKHYVEFMHRGSFFSEPSTKEIPSRDHPIELPTGAYAYRIFDREEVEVNGEKLTGKPKNYGPRYIAGEVFDLERVKAEVPDSDILQSNMKCNGWTFVIRCLQGFVEPHDGDVIISAA